MFDVLQRCYRDEFKGWEPKIKEMVPSFGYRLTDHEDLYHKINEEVTKYLQVK
ncbi:malate:quinone oxidoreductase [Staphylococcus aureus]|nr:Malate:quinone oxidoreductase [Staphylococcus aureus]